MGAVTRDSADDRPAARTAGRPGTGAGAPAGTADAGQETGTPAVPLARLFAIAYRDMVDGLHATLAERGWRDVRPAFGFVLLAVRGQGRTTTELAALLGTTKQAASKLVGAMVRAGYLAHGAHPGDSRAKPVTLTPRGHGLLAAVEEIYAELEARWAEVIGRPALEAVRTHLTTVLRATHGGQLPAIRPS
jgi:DNA-binding MarR family transcriptional regulator